MKAIKIRASQVGLIMSNPRTKTKAQLYTEALEKRKAKLDRLDSLGPKAIKTRDKLNEELVELEAEIVQLEKVKDQVELSESAITLLKEMYWTLEHGITPKEIYNKYLQKGIEAEDQSIRLAQEVNNWAIQGKNEELLENEYLTGTPDLIYPDFIPDIKTPYTAFSFPKFDSELKESRYYWQIQSYLALSGASRGAVVYCLVDTPEILVQDEIYAYARNNGLIETPPEVELDIRHAHNYSRLPKHLRVKTFYIDRDQEAIDRIYQRVEDCRKYYNEILLT
jgi:hypothetical protein